MDAKRVRSWREAIVLSWWILCVLCVGTLFFDRLPALLGTSPNTFDLAVAGLFAALLVYPLFKSAAMGDIKVEPAISFLSIGLEEVKTKVDAVATRLTFITSQQQRVTVQQGLTVMTPEALKVARPKEDAGIQQMAEVLNIDNLADKAKKESVMAPSTAVTEIDVLGEVVDRIESQLRRITQSAPGETRPNVVSIASALVKRDLLTPEVAGVVRNIVDIARAAQAGKSISQEHIKYVREMAPKLMVVLKTVPTAA